MDVQLTLLENLSLAVSRQQGFATQRHIALANHDENDDNNDDKEP